MDALLAAAEAAGACAAAEVRWVSIVLRVSEFLSVPPRGRRTSSLGPGHRALCTGPTPSKARRPRQGLWATKDKLTA